MAVSYFYCILLCIYDSSIPPAFINQSITRRKQYGAPTHISWHSKEILTSDAKALEVVSLGRLLDSISATCWVSFWDRNGPIITALEEINGDLPASAPFTMGDGKGVTRCTKTLWRRWQVQQLRQKSVFLQKVRLWQEAVCKMAALLFYTWDTMAALHAVTLLRHCYTAARTCSSCCQWGWLGESLQYQNPVASCR